MTRWLHHNSRDKSTLHLPRILCLHGGGTNVCIFRTQCRALEKALRPWFRLCYAEAPFPSNQSPDVKSVYHTFGPFYTWIDSKNTNPLAMAKLLQKSLYEAIVQDDDRGAAGPVVGLLGISQGARICASLILEQQLLDRVMNCQPNPLPKFHFAILLAAQGPLVTLSPLSVQADTMRKMRRTYMNHKPACNDGEDGETNLVLTRELIQIPTIHVHGRRDPSLEQHQKILYEYFDPQYTRVLERGGAHRPPFKSKDVRALVQEINLLWASVLFRQQRILPVA
ncbi:hypothetical protein N7493_008988 [Penicillium malachiteum]|uniref:Serine hydrolase domain-containing protein n=1 Tax=Penicillium malachiteum TaxID=1324776 RepID=A0AAD6MSZ5_9EURO|nr:hypothetical protein N7493_008988 [Penicillium malachiteum]